MAVSQQTRQSQLFAAEAWQTIYTAFTQVNFNAYDFPTIRTAMINYIRLNYPESFNDWIESSEFIALIDLIAYLGQSLAFRVDLNTRENFLDTATRRESIFRLARMLSYQPQRCFPASGLLKLSQVVTNQDIFDANGVNLNNVPIVWNDQNNPDWFEQFILVINATLNSTNTFGTPAKSGSVNSIYTELYNMNNSSIPTSVIPFTVNIAGNDVQMELANVDFNGGTNSNLLNSGNFYELDPDPLNSWNIVYRNDGNGYASANTGFFLYFKQGSVGFKDFLCEVPVANRVIDVDADNVNQTDVWVQNIDTNGLVNKKWTKVPSVNGFNVIYNSLDRGIRDIFSVISRDNNGVDQVSIRFADGNFGNAPVGIIRVWYRTSNNLTYQVRPTDITNQVFSFNYFDNFNNTWSVALTTNLQYTVSNAQSNESNYRIAQNAQQVYYTQDRMVNGEDYNLFPLQDGKVLKVKAVNRIYSGQSRYLDINDPTGSYNDLNVFCTDGMLYSENDTNMRDVVTAPGINLTEIANTQIQPLINGSLGNQTQALELKNFFYYNYPREPIQAGYTWSTITTLAKSCTGAFFYGSKAVQIGTTAGVSSPMHFLTQGALVTFSSGKIASVVGVAGDGTGLNQTGKISNGTGAVTMSNILTAEDNIPVSVIPAYRTTLTVSEISNIVAALATKTTFGIRYDPITTTWSIITYDNISQSDNFSLTYAGDRSSTSKDASWMIKVSWNGTGWKIYSRALRYIFESVRQNRFYFENIKKIYDPTTNTAELDYVSVLGINSNPITNVIVTTANIVNNSSQITVDSSNGLYNGQLAVGNYIYPGAVINKITNNTVSLTGNSTASASNVVVNFHPPLSLGNDYKWQVTGQQIYPDGYADPRSVRVTMWEGQNFGIPDDPDQFNEIVDPSPISNKLLFWEQLTGSDGYQYWTPVNIPSNFIFSTPSQVPAVSSIFWTEGQLCYIISDSKFYTYMTGKLIDTTSTHKMRIGRKDIKFLWKHFAPTDQRINPAVTNVIDMYVLTTAYDTDLRNWIATNGSIDIKPQPPTSAELKAALSDLEQYKQMTDQMIWHSVSYKVIFGNQADTEYQAKFKVVKTAGTSVTDNEIKSLVIQTINQYFSLNNWDFGQSFFFTELAAYIHQQLATIVGSVVITPLNSQAKFGDLFEIQCNSDEIFISGARVTDIQIVPALTESVLGITNG